MKTILLAVALAAAQGAPPPAPKPPPDPPFSAQAVQEVVRSHLPDVQSCYEQSMAEKGQTRKNAPGGRVVVAFTITTLGTVSEERIKSSSLKDSRVTDCILASVASWEFPRPEQSQPVEFPFDLRPVSGPKKKAK